MYEYYKIASTAKWSGTEYDPWRRFIGPLIYSAFRPVSEKYVEAFISSVVPLQIIWFSYCPLISSFFFNLSSPSPSHIIKSKQIFCILEQTDKKKMPWMQHATERNKPTHPRSSESAIWKNSPWYLPKTDTETTRVYECLSPFSCFFFLAKYCWLSHLRKETQVK